MDNNSQNQNNKRPGSGRNNSWMMILALLCTVVVIFLFYNMLFGGKGSTQTKEYTEFINDLENDRVEAVELDAENAELTVTLKLSAVLQESDSESGGADTSRLEQYAYYVQLQNERIYTTRLMESMDNLMERLEEHGVSGQRVVSTSSGLLTEIFVGVVLPVLLLWLLASFLMRRMGGGSGPLNVGKSNAKVYVQKETGITFKDVAGEDEAKESLVEVVDFLHNPGKYSGIGAKLPKGALLVGPPGTGKTLLAKAVAGEAHVPFFSLTGSDFIELYVGVGASRVRDLFKEATKNAPCIIFIDEIDAIGRSRDSKYGGGNEEREQTLNQLLSEMDGFDSSKGILILGATNRPEILDKALLRPGRFDRRIIVDKPDLKGRVEILKVHAKNVKMDESVDLDAIALATSGAVGSDLANMINEAAINAVKEGREYVCQKDLFNAVEQVLVGKEKKDRIMSPEERKIVSYHEVGHALITALQKNSEPVQKITIVPRTMGALGYVMQVPEEEKYLNSKEELENMIVSALGGRAAEEIVFGNVTTGAANDIEKATSIAKNMITRFGMSDRFGLAGFATVESQYLEGRTSLNCSDQTAAAIDEEVVAMLKKAYDKAKELLSENRELMDKLAGYLIEKETITGKEFMKIFRQEKGLPEPEEEHKDVTGSEAAEGAAQAAGVQSADAQTGTNTQTGDGSSADTVAQAGEGASNSSDAEENDGQNSTRSQSGISNGADSDSQDDGSGDDSAKSVYFSRDDDSDDDSSGDVGIFSNHTI